MRGRTFQAKGVLCAQFVNLERTWHALGAKRRSGCVLQFMLPSFVHFRLCSSLEYLFSKGQGQHLTSFLLHPSHLLWCLAWSWHLLDAGKNVFVPIACLITVSVFWVRTYLSLPFRQE